MGARVGLFEGVRRKPNTFTRRSKESLSCLPPPDVEPLVRGLVIFCGRLLAT
jgi:hypothetical protein